MSIFHGKFTLRLKQCPLVSDICVTIRRAGGGVENGGITGLFGMAAPFLALSFTMLYGLLAYYLR